MTRLVGAVLRLVPDGVVILRAKVRYFCPQRKLNRLQLQRGDVVSFQPAESMQGTPIALNVRRQETGGMKW